MKPEPTEMEKLQMENAELIQRIQQLERKLAMETAYNHAIVTVINKKYPD